MHRVCCLLLATFSLSTVDAQDIGTWQSHSSFQSGRAVEIVGNNVYTASRFGLFYYDKLTGESTSLSKIDGLSDVGISRLFYDPTSSRLLISYQNGNIDLVPLTAQGVPDSEKTLINLDAIKTASQLPNSRKTNQIIHLGNGPNVYLSTDFGIVVINPTRAEIQDTYRTIGPGGSTVSVTATALSHDTLFALTNRGLLAAPFSATINLAYFGNWRLVSVPSTRTVSALGSVNDQLQIAINGVGIYERQQGKWVLVKPNTSEAITFFANPRRAATTGAVSQLIATGQTLTGPGSATFKSSLLTAPQDAVADGTNVWVADAQNGLLAGKSGTFQAIVPEGPPTDQFPRLYAFSQHLVALGGNNLDTPLELDNFRESGQLAVAEGRWQAFANTVGGAFNSAAYVPNLQQTFLGSYGGGLWVQTENQPPVVVALPSTISPYITALATDYEGNLWIATAGADTRQAALHVRRSNGQFESFRAVSQRNFVQIIPDDNGYLWLRLSYSSIVVFDPRTGQSRNLYAAPNEGNLPNNTVRAMAKDKNGLIWAGTDLGIVVFDDPANVFTGAVNANAPILNRRRLLANETITAIAVDGGNRKWIATRSGLYRVGPDGTELLETFTTANTPLPSDQILDLSVEPVSGSVFVATTAGLVSYRGMATEPADALSTITIFPNPVRPDFSGTVGIRGLVDNATVKILDAAGQLVYETRAQGGTATWNLLDYRGRSVQTGVYLVVVIKADGSEGLAGKLAIVR